MAERKRSGSDSRCCTPVNPAWVWINIEEPEHEQLVTFAEWLAAMTDTARAIEEGEIEELLDAASAGLLEDSGDSFTPIKPVTHVPEIFELRRRSGATKPRVYLRFYHCEPAALPNNLIALHRHIKDSDDSQTVGLAQAIQRYNMGEQISWNN